MLVAGLLGSPRKKGNTDYLLSLFMKEAEALGVRTETVRVCDKNILPCKELIVCEKKGTCPLEDDMDPEIYPLLREAEVIVLASPIFFYNVTAQLKALIDRSQTLWARKYKLKLSDPKKAMRRGFLLSTGATKGKNLFEGAHLTARYFFDAVDAVYHGGLTYTGIEHRGDMKKYPHVEEEVKDVVTDLVRSFQNRRRILFACRENACRSQMAAAFAGHLAGKKIEALCGGSEPAAEINPLMAKVMAEKGIDMAFLKPRSIEAAILKNKPDMIVTMGCNEACPAVPGAKMLDWDLPDPAEKPLDFMRQVRDDIEKKVSELIGSLE